MPLIEDRYPTQDTWITNDSPTTNYGTSNVMTIGASSGKSGVIRYTALINFDVSDIPAGSTIDDAKITFFVSALGWGGGFIDYSVHRIHENREDWHETQATSNEWKTGSSWTGQNATSAGVDYALSVPDGYTFQGPSASGEFWDLTGLATFVQDAVDNRAGILRIIIGRKGTIPSGNNNSFTVSSREYIDPELVINYTEPAGATGNFFMFF